MAEKESGSIDVEFVIDTKDLAGTTLVAYEYLKLNGKTVAKHEDINDEDQTVTFTKETPPDEKVKTGAGILVAILMGLVLGFGGAGIYTLRRKKKFF